MLLLYIINDSFQSVKHPFCIVVSDLHVVPAPLPVKLDDAPQLHPGTDPVHLTVLRQSYFWLSARSVDPYFDQVGIPFLHKDIRRDIVEYPSVNIPLAVFHGLILKAQEICACQQEILQMSLRNLRDAQLQLLHVRQRKCHDAEFFRAAPYLLFIHSLMDQLPQWGDVHSPIPKDPPQFRKDIADLLFPLKELSHPIIIHRHHMRELHLTPDPLRLLHIIHADKSAVQRAYGSSRHGAYLYSRFFQRLPRADLISAPCTSAVKNKSIFFCQVK